MATLDRMRLAPLWATLWLGALGCGAQTEANADAAGSDAQQDVAATDSAADDLDTGDEASDQAQETADSEGSDTADACDPAACDDGNPCTDDGCGDSGCVHGPAAPPRDATVTACDDGDPCTVGDGCAKGVCQPGAADGCDDSNPCTTDSCLKGVGCQAVPASGTCDDGDPCTSLEACQGGACLAASKTDCSDANPCTQDTCSADGKGCVAVPLSHSATASALCDDGDACTLGDACKQGTCQPGPADLCDDGNPCTKDACTADKGCSHQALAAGACDDQDACSVNEACKDGVCLAGATTACDDENACTDDGCDPGKGCTHKPNTSPCDDQDACTVLDVCQAGACKAGVAGGPCDDGNPCTTDVCNKKTGCSFAENAASCDDGNACTVADACQGKVCQAGAAKACDDNNPCTADSCDASMGCKQVSASLPCDDKNACTIGDICAAGQCTKGKSKTCNDGDVCTDDGCDSSEGTCTKTPNSASCNDGDSCTGSDTCKNGVCKSGTLNACDDGNSCTFDVCNALSGCQSVATAATCDDGDGCSVGDVCAAGVCKAGGVKDCSSGKPCVVDSCSNGACASAPGPNGDACDDGDPCTAASSCASGKCAPALKHEVQALLHAVSDLKSVDEMLQGDFTGDGISDVVMLLRAGDLPTIRLLVGGPGGSLSPKTAQEFSTPDSCTVSDGAWRGAIADVNGDGKLDVLIGGATVAQQCSLGSGPPLAHYASLALNLGGGVFAAPKPLYAPAPPAIAGAKLSTLAIAYGRFKPGGAKQVALWSAWTDEGASPATVGTWHVLEPTVEGVAVSWPALSGAPSALVDATLQAQAKLKPVVAQVADLDGDGRDELVMRSANLTGAMVSGAIFSNPSDKPGGVLVLSALGAFGGKIGHGSVVPVDFNGDGKVDLVSQSFEAISGNGQFTDAAYLTLANTTKGWWTDASAPKTALIAALSKGGPSTAHALVGAADLNGDGKIDLFGLSQSNPKDGARMHFWPQVAGTPFNGIVVAPSAGDTLLAASVRGGGTHDVVSLHKGGLLSGQYFRGACVDGQPCTANVCDPGKGCKASPTLSLCDDGDACSVGDSCGGTATCNKGKEALECTGGPCELSSCDKVLGCKVTTLADGMACDDGEVCTVSDACKAGQCLGTQKTCDDQDVCTHDECDPSSGCKYSPGNNGKACGGSGTCAESGCACPQGQGLDPKGQCAPCNCGIGAGHLITGASRGNVDAYTNQSPVGRRAPTSVHVRGDRMIIGMPHFSTDSSQGEGAVSIFERANGAWTLTAAALGAPKPEEKSAFGVATAIEGHLAFAGRPSTHEISSFGRSISGVWKSVATLAVASGEGFGANFAYCLGTLVVGSGIPGSAQVPVLRAISVSASGTFGAMADLTPAGTQAGDGFAAPRTLTCEGKDLFLGAVHHGGKGAVYVFAHEGGKYVLKGKLLPPPGLSPAADGAEFGVVAARGDDLFVGGPQYKLASGGKPLGLVVHFRRTLSGAFALVGLISDGSTTNGDLFGSALAVSEDGRLLLVGAPGRTLGNVASAGHGGVFALGSEGWKLNRWLTPLHPTEQAGYGKAAALAGQLPVLLDVGNANKEHSFFERWTLTTGCKSGLVCACVPGWKGDLCGQSDCSAAPDLTSCEDGNVCSSGDRCEGKVCKSGKTPSEVCNGIDDDCDETVDEGSLCDDANACTNDTCSNGKCGAAPVSNGTPCPGGKCAAGACVLDPVCGDGAVSGGESCDDSNTAPGDGCSPSCAKEPGYTCQGMPSVCTPVDPCDSAPCKNNGSCTAVFGASQCTCQKEFGGSNCGHQVTSSWNVSGGPSLPEPRSHHALVELADGRVALIGGLGGSGQPLANLVIYDPATNAISASSNQMGSGRRAVVALRLPNGKIAVVFGLGDSNAVTNDIYLYDPSTNSFDDGATKLVGRVYHSVTLLADGKLLIAGGTVNVAQGTRTAFADVYDPIKKTSTQLSLLLPRHSHNALRLLSGKVLIANGLLANPVAEVFDPATSKFQAVPVKYPHRLGGALTLLHSGKVLISGGGTDDAELYDPATDKVTLISPGPGARAEHSTTLLQDGRVLFAGGRIGATHTDTTSYYVPATGKFVPGPKLPTVRLGHAAVLLDSGQVLLASGVLAATNIPTKTSVLVDVLANSAIQTATSMLTHRTDCEAIKLSNGKVFYAGGKSASTLATTDLFE